MSMGTLAFSTAPDRPINDEYRIAKALIDRSGAI
jgi:hypothetical protein